MQGTLVLLFYFAINCRMQQCELELDIPFHYSKVTRKNWVDSNTKLYPNLIHSAGKPLIILISRLVCVFFLLALDTQMKTLSDSSFLVSLIIFSPLCT